MLVLNGLDLSNQRIVNQGDPVNPQDSATKNYVDTRGFVTASQAITWTGVNTWVITDVTASSVTTIGTFDHENTGAGGQPAAGFGGRLAFKLKSNATVNRDAASIDWLWTTATDASRTAALDIRLENLASVGTVQVARFFGSGGLTVGGTPTTDPGSGIINAVTGFWAGNAADPAGEFLRSDGAKYTGSNIQASDLTSAIANSLTFTAAQLFIVNDAVTGLTNILTLGHNTTGTPTVNSTGTAILFQSETDTNTSQTQAQISTKWSIITQATRSAYVDISTVLNGTLGLCARFTANNGLSVGGSTTDPGTGVINASTGFKINNTDLNFSHLVGIAGITQGGTGLASASANNFFANNTGSAAAPAWSAMAALTKTDDTNVTLTLGGTPATALFKAVSITAGWTGTLSVARGGMGADVTPAAGDTPRAISTSAYGNFAPNTAQGTTTDPANTASTVGLMCGFKAAFTPKWSGRVLVIIAGRMGNTTAGALTSTSIRYGTGTAPNDGAALTGTAVGNAPFNANFPTNTNCYVPFSCMAIITGLTINTAYWFDLTKVVGSGASLIAGCTYSILEL